ncbi:MAG: Spy/CpxP family protein refolding chaperone [Cyanobacteria bacterium HKST-UBA02]|nr:Spy/CpxP family protein refolding chaperone [Cyanobacteria bacterium HKST-UBA02]
MRKSMFPLLLCCMVAVSPALAQADPATGDAPADPGSMQNRIERHMGKKEGRKGHKKDGHMKGHGGRANRKIFMAGKLKSLTPDQKTQIDALASDFKTRSTPLRQQMRDLRRSAAQAESNAGEAGTPPADNKANRAQMKEISGNIKSMGDETWTKMSAILTPEQVAELDSMPMGGHKKGKGGHHRKPKAEPQAESQ